MKSVVSALIRRRRELSCDMNKLQADIAAIDRVLCLFDPAMRPEQIPALAFYRREDWARRGEISRAVIEIVRKASGPITSGQIIEQMGGEGSRQRQSKRIHKALNRHRVRGLLVADRSGRLIMWRLADQAARCQ